VRAGGGGGGDADHPRRRRGAHLLRVSSHGSWRASRTPYVPAWRLYGLVWMRT
jgi:hypothetical protein